jgi:hypothetical protein
MLSTLNQPEQDPHDVIEIAPDVVLAARTDKPSPTPATGTLGGASAPEVRVAPDPAVSTPSVDTSFRATTLDDIRIPGERSAFARWAMRSLMAFVFAICSAVAAAAWQHYGDQAQQMLADWTPPRINLASLFSSDKPTASEQSAAPAVTAAAATDQASTQTASAQPAPVTSQQPAPATPPAQSSATAAAPPAAAAPSADTMQLMQSMAHDITAMSQQIADLKTSIDQLKTRQEQMSRDLAKAAEAKIAEAKAAETKAVEMRAFERQRIVPPRAAPVRKPRPVYTPVQASAVPPPPPAAAAPLPSSQPIAPLPPPAMVQPDGDPVVRPPMPVH